MDCVPHLILAVPLHSTQNIHPEQSQSNLVEVSLNKHLSDHLKFISKLTLSEFISPSVMFQSLVTIIHHSVNRNQLTSRHWDTIHNNLIRIHLDASRAPQTLHRALQALHRALQALHTAIHGWNIHKQQMSTNIFRQKPWIYSQINYLCRKEPLWNLAILCKSFNLESINSIALNYHINEDIKMSSCSQVWHGCL